VKLNIPKQPSIIKAFFVELFRTLHIFLILVVFSLCVLLIAKGVSPFHMDIDQRASDYSQLE
jgi:hypothetical protein